MRDNNTEFLRQSGLWWTAGSYLCTSGYVDYFTLCIQCFSDIRNVYKDLEHRDFPGDMSEPSQLSWLDTS
ncbi:hypothetical protein DPMN_024710 [Dreissena polymorpha]|uniref:Uncharacterized protein n=1 Tax=Dreissena polymorpha TaxID=45954 RepID=A0A9D4LPE4_DREPO|nr:hypothetical protein DPMN_024710 [Dreissena polymorpha]